MEPRDKERDSFDALDKDLFDALDQYADAVEERLQIEDFDLGELEAIMFDGYYDHPDLGRIEPDHPESPLYKMGLI